MAKGQFYITSTLSADVTYRRFAQTGGDVPVPHGEVTISGGANLQGKVHTPRGVATILSAEQYEICEADPVFKAHVKAGYLTVSNSASDPEAVVSDMEQRDQSAPLEENDFTDETAPKPVENAPAPAAATNGGPTRNQRRGRA